MEENKSLEQLIVRLEKSNQQQAKYARRQFVLSILAVLFCAAMFLLVWRMVPRVTAAFGQLETVLTNLEVVTDQLAAADLEGMAQNVDQLVRTGQSGVESAVEKLNAIDFDTLNRAIRDLADVVEPLANFFNILHR